MRYERIPQEIPQDGNVISLPGRSDRPSTAPPTASEPSAEQRAARDALVRALDALLVAQFELCGLDPHPTRASLSEMRFRQAREALEEGIDVLRDLMGGDDRPAPIERPTPPRQDEVYAAD